METAIIIPVMLFLITGFIGLMIQVELQQQLDAATKLAAESTFQAPRGEVDADGMPTRCRFARETFEGTMSFYFTSSYANAGSDAAFTGATLSNQYLKFQQVPICQTTIAGYGVPPPPQVGASPTGDIQCDIDYQDPNPQLGGIHMTYCHTTVKLDYSKTPLAWAVFWSPTLKSQAETAPPPFRQ